MKRTRQLLDHNYVNTMFLFQCQAGINRHGDFAPLEDLKYVKISFSLLNERSQLAIDTGTDCKTK